MKRFALIVFSTLLLTLSVTAQSLYGNWEAQIEIPDAKAPSILTINPYLNEDGSLAIHLEINMTVNIMQGAPEGELQLGFANDLEGTWTRKSNNLSFTITTDHAEVYGTNIMMPNLDVEQANKIVEQLQPTIVTIKDTLVGQFESIRESFNTSFTITQLTNAELILADETGSDLIFERADVGEYDPE